jgi:hypothetical protein
MVIDMKYESSNRYSFDLYLFHCRQKQLIEVPSPYGRYFGNYHRPQVRVDVVVVATNRAGWMCSPHPDIMADCNAEHNGDHRLAVTRILRKWFAHEVTEL